MTDITKELNIAEAELCRADPLIARIIQSQTPIRHSPRTNYFASLCQSIISQQVSTLAAAAIFARLKQLTDLNPAQVVGLTPEQVKIIGLSRQKASYLMDLAGHFVANPRVYNHLSNSTDEEVITELTSVKGIGIWTAQMFLMFTLVRLDVFAPADLGLQKAIIQLYGLKKPILPNR